MNIFEIFPPQTITIIAFAVIVALFFFNAKKHFKQVRDNMPKKSIEMPNPCKTTPKEAVRTNAQVHKEQNFAGGYKPESVAKWETEFFELTRNMSTKIDAKISALTAITSDANQVCKRMESLTQKLDEQLVSMKSLQNSEPKTSYPEEKPTGLRPENYDNYLPRKETHLSSFREPLPKTQASSLIPPLDFSDDLGSLAAIGADILADDEHRKPQFQSDRKASSLPELSTFHDAQSTEKSLSLGELLFQDKKQTQSVMHTPQSRVLSPLQNPPSGAILKPSGSGFAPLQSAEQTGDRKQIIRSLAKQGLSILEISNRLNISAGEVELIIATSQNTRRAA